MGTDYQVGDELTKYRPKSRPIEEGEMLPAIPPFADKEREREYLRQRELIRKKIWGEVN